MTGLVPSYLPLDGWNLGPQCTGCFIQLDPSQTFEGTWHDATSNPSDTRSVTASFAGTAVYVYGIVANTVPFTSTITNLTFQLDGKDVGTYLHTPTTSTDFQYHTLLYSNPNIPNGDHTIACGTNGHTADNFLILFDYIIYTFQDDSDSSPTVSSQSPPSPISPPALPTQLPPSSPPTSTSPSPSSSNITSTSLRTDISSTENHQSTVLTPLLATSASFQVSQSATGTQDPSSTVGSQEASASRDHRVIVGASVGGGAGILLVLAISAMLLRRRSKLRGAATSKVRSSNTAGL